MYWEKNAIVEPEMIICNKEKKSILVIQNSIDILRIKILNWQNDHPPVCPPLRETEV